ncbi:MAG: fructosamine kinase family protein [Bacteroidetes bacterium]|nr:fructosamine kinase family protein [Bacteroidota bacterium]
MMNPYDAFRMAWESLFFECPQVFSISQLAGGSINQVFKVESSDGQFVMKLNSLAKYPNMYSAEAKGLKILSETRSIACPEVIGVCELETHQILILSFVTSGKKVKNFFEDFGSWLAHLHRNTSIAFGLDHDNYIGHLPQINNQEVNASDFFVNQRLLPQLNLAVANKSINKEMRIKFDSLFLKMDALIPNEPPALIHGDLWNGNFIVGEDGKVVLIDPAIAYASRESELAMTLLFGGFDASFYTSYEQEFPLADHWRERIQLWNLYPLLVHVNLFGDSYLKDVERNLRKFLD